VGVIDVNVTGYWELAVADRTNGTAVLIGCAGMEAKVMVCCTRLTVKLCETGAAAA